MLAQSYSAHLQQSALSFTKEITVYFYSIYNYCPVRTVCVFIHIDTIRHVAVRKLNHLHASMYWSASIFFGNAKALKYFFLFFSDAVAVAAHCRHYKRASTLSAYPICNSLHYERYIGYTPAAYGYRY